MAMPSFPFFQMTGFPPPTLFSFTFFSLHFSPGCSIVILLLKSRALINPLFQLLSRCLCFVNPESRSSDNFVLPENRHTHHEQLRSVFFGYFLPAPLLLNASMLRIGSLSDCLSSPLSLYKLLCSLFLLICLFSFAPPFASCSIFDRPHIFSRLCSRLLLRFRCTSSPAQTFQLRLKRTVTPIALYGWAPYHGLPHRFHLSKDVRMLQGVARASTRLFEKLCSM